MNLQTGRTLLTQIETFTRSLWSTPHYHTRRRCCAGRVEGETVADAATLARIKLAARGGSAPAPPCQTHDRTSCQYRSLTTIVTSLLLLRYWQCDIFIFIFMLNVLVVIRQLALQLNFKPAFSHCWIFRSFRDRAEVYSKDNGKNYNKCPCKDTIYLNENYSRVPRQA